MLLTFLLLYLKIIIIFIITIEIFLTAYSISQWTTIIAIHSIQPLKLLLLKIQIPNTFYPRTRYFE